MGWWDGALGEWMSAMCEAESRREEMGVECRPQGRAESGGAPNLRVCVPACLLTLPPPPAPAAALCSAARTVELLEAEVGDGAELIMHIGDLAYANGVEEVGAGGWVGVVWWMGGCVGAPTEEGSYVCLFVCVPVFGSYEEAGCLVMVGTRWEGPRSKRVALTAGVLHR